MNPSKSLVSRYADFWLLGGLSVLVWLVMMVAQNFHRLAYVHTQFTNIPFTAASLALVVNYPHFLASYKLAYLREARFLQRQWFQLVLVPVVLVAVLAYSFFSVAHKTEILGHMVNLMFLSVGWHYTKQCFGCVMVYAKFDDYFLSNWERNLIRWNLLGIWILSFVNSNLRGGYATYYGMPYRTYDLPSWAELAAAFFLVASTAAVILLIFFRRWRQEGRWPSPNMLIPLVAMQVWWVPFIRQNDFYAYLTPFFHSLQYLAFVYKIETAKYNQEIATRDFKYSVTLIGLFVAGWAAFEIIPNSLDKYFFPSGSIFPFFLISALIFINIHHYFIDNAIWRFRDPEIKKNLLS